MAKTLNEAPLTTKNARSKLDRGLHWRGIDPDVHIGYRKGPRGGRWLVRWYLGDNAYEQRTLASADDSLPPNGLETLDYAQAVLRARETVIEARADAKAEKNGSTLTVSSAAEEYLVFRSERDTSVIPRDARSRMAKYVVGDPIAKIALHRLEDQDLRDWKSRLPERLAQTTVRRLVNDLKACLNLAAERHRKRLPADFQSTVKFGLRTDGASSAPARRQVLTDEQVRSIIKATITVDADDGWDGDLTRMILILAATGARMSQVARLTVGDVKSERSVLMVPASKKGRGSKQLEHIAVPVSTDVIVALEPILKQRKPEAPLLQRWRHKQIAPSTWVRDRRGPWKSASELTRPWATIIKKADVPADTLIYALRHSSIVRGLRQGLPTRLVAALHDTSSAMIEKHYAAYISDALEDLAAKAVVSLVG